MGIKKVGSSRSGKFGKAVGQGHKQLAARAAWIAVVHTWGSNVERHAHYVPLCFVFRD